MKNILWPKFNRALLLIFSPVLIFAPPGWAAPGDLDLTFRGTGEARTGFGGGHDVAYAATVQSDGKLVLAGASILNYPSGTSIFALARLDTNNLLDATFGDGGKALTLVRSNATVNAVRVQADGKIVAAGLSSDAGYSDFTLARYNPDGSLDTTFGTNGTGIVYTDFGEGTVIKGMAIQADGKIVVAGYTTYVANAGEGAVALARYETNGTLDLSFGTGGKQVTTGVIGYTGAHAVTIQSDGKILAVGLGIGPGHHGVDFALYRYTTNGVLDTAFGGGTGQVFTLISSNGSSFDYFDSANAVAIQFGSELISNPDKIVVAGSYQNETTDKSVFAICRYNLDGSLDSSFGNNGIVTNAITAGSGVFDGDVGYSLVIQGQLFSPRKIIVGGTSLANNNTYFTVARYTATGTLDTTFGAAATGKVTIPIGAGVDAQAYAMALQSGKYVLGGYTGVFEHNYDFLAARLNADGSPDTNFGSGGVVTADLTDLASQAQAVAIQANGKIVVAGSANNSTNNVFALARYNADGSLDPGFNAGGKVLTVVGTNDSATYALAIQPDQKILTAGVGNGDFALVRYNANGSLDPTFGNSGIVTTPIGAGNDTARALALQRDGRIVAAGFSYNGANDDFALVRYTTNGVPDASFGTAGKTTTAISTGEDQANAVAIQADGKIVVAGYGTVGPSADFALTRYTTNGVLDTSFGSFGRVITDFGSGSFAEAFAMVIQPDNKIVVAGAAVVASTAYFALARYVPANGALDTSFGVGGKVTSQVGLVLDYGTSLALQPDGRIVVGGLSQIGAHNQFAILRYRSDGSLDPTYGTAGKVVISFNSGADETGNGVALDSAGRIVIAGDAGGEFGVARLLGDPGLRIALTGVSKAVVSWPFPSLGWNLQQTANLLTPNWQSPAEPVNNDGTNNFIVVNPPVGARFYRLVSP
jgi:uncharacterized delta-60 repeat protein